MFRCSLFLVLFLIPSFVLPAEAPQNTTFIALPNHYSNHGDPNLLCRTAKWSDIAIFFLGNYVAHAATTLTLPGQSFLGKAFTVIMALLFPTSGVYNGMSAIFSRAVRAKTDLQTAARAGALCMVVKDEVKEGDMHGELDVYDRRREFSWDPKKKIALLSTKIHGRYHLPDGYALTIVPRDARFQDDPEPQGTFLNRFFDGVKSLFKATEQSPIIISCNYNFTKILVALGQTLFAIATLYRTRGDQIDRYGYAAFGLTVTPYAFMSVVNLLGSLMCPEYPALYLVESNTMNYARDEIRPIEGAAVVEEGTEEVRGSRQPQQGTRPYRYAVEGTMGEPKRTMIAPRQLFEGVVGKLAEDFETLPLRQQSLFGYGGARPYGLLLDYVKLILAAAVPIGLIWGMSSFCKGSSTLAQRVWTMTWLVFGIMTGPLAFELKEAIESRMYSNGLYGAYLHGSMRLGLLGALLFYSAPAIGGFVVVGQMLKDYGVCMRIT